ncbi:MAG: exonuclease SbcCD subunit D [Firmicutes bacterium]|nr:exonuclease SbcCD subunit D [Bacillota bacterium]
MRFLQVGDLHIGKRLNEVSLLEDQQYILRQILDLAAAETVDALLICGDVYDKALPSVEAVEMLDDFLCEIAARELPCFIIAGNHDSAERLSFASRLVAARNIHIARAYQGSVESYCLQDEHGPVHIHLLPFIRPLNVRRYFEECGSSYQEAVQLALAAHPLALGARHVLMAHQFVTAAGMDTQRCDSEAISVGGLDNIDAGLFAAFDYVALGHIHTPQAVGRPQVRYSGSPLAYSFSEVGQQKSVTIIELGELGEAAQVRTVPLTPLRQMYKLKGGIEELTASEFVAAQDTEGYYQITLTDVSAVDAHARLKHCYPRLLQLDFARTQAADLPGSAVLPGQSYDPLQLFGEFYLRQNGAEATPEQLALIEELLAEGEGE